MTGSADFREISLPNGYVLINGVDMNRRFGDRFAIVNQWFKKHVAVDEFVEIRIDSDRFSAHPDAEPGCPCELCGEEVSKPILSHEQPISLLAVPLQEVPSQGWGEEFWVKVTQRQDWRLRGVIDNHLYETKLHGLQEGDEIVFQVDHILSIHSSHNEAIIMRLSEDDRQQFGQWLMSRPGLED
jgi:hypothetical protein